MRNQESEIGFLGATAGLPSSALYHLFERALVSGVLQWPLPGDESPGFFLTPFQGYGLSRKKRERKGTPMGQSVITFENRYRTGRILIDDSTVLWQSFTVKRTSSRNYVWGRFGGGATGRRAILRAGWCGSFIYGPYRPAGRGCFEKGFGFMLCTGTLGYRGMGPLGRRTDISWRTY